MSFIRGQRLRFGIGSLLVVTASVALFVRLTTSYVPIEITFDDLRLDEETPVLNIPQDLPKSIKNLHNKSVHLRGYILPTSVFKEKGNRQFILCRDNQEPPDSVTDDEFIVVRMVGDTGVDFVTRPVAITGRFKVLDPPLVGTKRTLFYEIAAEECQ